MTEEERERYVNQDVVGRSSREVLYLSDRFAHYCEAASAERPGLASVFAGIGYLSPDSALHFMIDPVSMECLRLYYGEGRSCRQIANAIEMLCVVDGCVLVSKRLTSGAVKKRIFEGRAALKKVLGEDVLQGFKDLRNNQ